MEKSVNSIIKDSVLEPLQEKADVLKENLNHLKNKGIDMFKDGLT